MANPKILNQKQETINEISAKVKESSSIVFFEYRGLSVTEMTELRRKLRESDSDLKVYKNTLVGRALNSMDINLDEHLNGPKAVAFSKDAIVPIKILSDYAKSHTALELKVGIIDGEIVGIDTLKQLASIPSREGLLTMLAGGMIGLVRDLSISLDLYSKQKEN